jgi:hypothetical protein
MRFNIDLGLLLRRILFDIPLTIIGIFVLLAFPFTLIQAGLKYPLSLILFIPMALLSLGALGLFLLVYLVPLWRDDYENLA